MAKFSVGDRVIVLDKPNWPDGGYKIANWKGKIVEVLENPAGYVIIKADKTGYHMMFHEKEIDQLQPGKKDEQISDHDGALGFLDTLQRKTKGNSNIDINLDI